ncbi:diaminopimelate epimerase [Anaeromicropila populeti]|uniref:Diaminopimelate epimerase n=1 Tax=Anaeromicropila populeti TaxID=37658 RepID=A0A1I6KWE1_9FIRM|nr:diaminopimelate epimerase [Anaeromicropila populeti]SFR95559.1 diaminopimelate epimerase [Anaeromicropila populeti]
MKFTKMQGCGNDYIYVNCFEETVENPQEVSKVVSDRHFGIGSDGLILIQPSDVADFRMSMYNADGSESQMCGNGVRCIAKYVYDNGMTDKKRISLETKAGIKYLDVFTEEGKVKRVSVDMGSPITMPSQIPIRMDKDIVIDEAVQVMGNEYRITGVSMGNPHCVVFVEDTEKIDIERIGPAFEYHALFPERINTEFIQIIDRKTIRMRVWERGTGETLACGTGACASVVACALNELTEDEVTVKLLGGELFIQYDREAEKVIMTGPAEVICTGEIEIEKSK